MAVRYQIPAQTTRTVTDVHRSRFICTVGHADTAVAAQVFIARVKSGLSDASSQASAFCAGYGASVNHGCSDGGEPHGTAGQPMLAVLKGSGLGDVAAVVSRYFGGTKLGAGGLVRAISEAVQNALLILPRIEMVERSQFEVAVGYAHYEGAKRICLAGGGHIINETFAASVILRAEIAIDALDNARQQLRDMSGGRCVILP